MLKRLRGLWGWFLGLLHRFLLLEAFFVKLLLLLPELLDIFFVLSSFENFLFDIRRSISRTSITPHFTEKSRYIRVGHIWIGFLYLGSAPLRELQKCTHGSLRRQRMLLGASFRSWPRPAVLCLLSGESTKSEVQTK